METLLEATKLTKTFNPGKHSEVRAVRDLSLRVQKGEIILIMGPSGSGKTTLVTMLGALLKPTGGEVRLAGKALSSLTQAELTDFRRDHVGFIFQSFQLLESLTAMENVEIIFRLAGRNQHQSRQAATALLERLGLGKRLIAYPKELSGGEKQRVSVARALANDPAIIFADEPTANLDSKSGHEVMQLLCATACEQHRTVVIVSHDQRLKDVARRVLWMEDGRLTRSEPGGHERWCTMPHERRSPRG